MHDAHVYNIYVLRTSYNYVQFHYTCTNIWYKLCGVDEEGFKGTKICSFESCDACMKNTCQH